MVGAPVGANQVLVEEEDVAICSRPGIDFLLQFLDRDAIQDHPESCWLSVCRPLVSRKGRPLYARAIPERPSRRKSGRAQRC